MDHTQSISHTTSTISTSRSQDTIHIVYVHGFQGDHTTFQAFPSDLHNHLLPYIPNLQSWIYPTYKSAKPLSFAVKNFLIWLASLSEGHIILSGHSMGGLLVAEAVTDKAPVTQRIIGMIAFDTPYLGMHPHVVVSGIASLFQKKEEPPKAGERPKSSLPMEKTMPPPIAQGMTSETALNDHDKVNFVSTIDAYPEGTTSPTSSVSSRLSSGTGMFHPYHPPNRSPSDLSMKSAQSLTSSMITSTLSFFQKHPNERFMRFLNKHSDAPFYSMARWVVQYFEFGFAMFDYGELLERYRKLEKWDGDWVNYWTVTVPKQQSGTLEVVRTRSVEEDSASATEDEGWMQPPAPRRVSRMQAQQVTFSKQCEQDFETMMRRATKKDEKRIEKEEAKRREMEQKERLRIAAEDEKLRKKEEERQEKERILALEKLEKEQEGREKEMTYSRKAKEEGLPITPTIAIEESRDQEAKNLYIGADSAKGIAPTTHEATPPYKQDYTVSSRPVSPTHSNRSSRPPSPDQGSPRHFITLPSKTKYTGLCKNRWLKVPIAGVEDEVAAHTGLFFRHQNLEYEHLVERVGKLVRSWVE